MKTTLLTLAIASVTTLAFGQQEPQRYLDPIFDEVEVSDTLVEYNRNFSFLPVLAQLTTSEVPLPNFFRAYMPKGDLVTNRPVVILNTTGSYLPQFVAGSIFSTIDDSVMVNVATRFAKMGYVAVTASYRQGWIPTAQQQPLRTSTLLVASYKGVQDARTLGRFLRMTEAEMGNPYGIDPDRLMFMGFGTGGYNAYNQAFLDNPEDVTSLSRFFNAATGASFLDPAKYGDPDGLREATNNVVQWPGYDSKVQFTAAIGGAGGDTSWVDANDPPIVGFHSTDDTNAPFAEGDVNVPVSPTTSLFVIRVFGPRGLIQKANDIGVNDPLDSLNAALLAANDFLTMRVNTLSDVSFTTRSEVETTLATKNFYPFVTSGTRANGYNYIDSTQLVAKVKTYNDSLPDGAARVTAAQYLGAERRSNPNITNPAAANRVIDTVMNYTIPRAYIALGLGQLNDIVSSVTDITAADVNFNLYPNPMIEESVIEVREDVELQLLAIYDMSGRRVTATRLSGNKFTIARGNLPAGNYTVYVQTSEGALSTQLIAR